ncbi:hypothetical protein [Aeromicrobium sp.]|uniref:hypothetical protein n=1 Tax=Aeromicrobium sp. TaxID=1871063 RepID=UPI003C47233A
MAGNTYDENDAESAGENSALTGLAAAAPQVAAAAAAIDKADDLVDAAKDAGKWVGGALDDVFGGGDEHPGESTFPVDPNAIPETEEEFQAKMAKAEEAMDKGGVAGAKAKELWNGRHQDVEHVIAESEAADMKWAAKKARAGRVHDAATELHDGVFDDPRLEDVGSSGPHTTAGGAIDPDQLPTADHTPADVPIGSDVELNPQPIPPGKAADQLFDVDDSSIIIVGGKPVARRAKEQGPTG